MLFVIKHFTKYTLCCRTHLTTLSHLLAVGGVTLRDVNSNVVSVVSQCSPMRGCRLACGDQRRRTGSGSALETLRDDALYTYTFRLLYVKRRSVLAERSRSQTATGKVQMTVNCVKMLGQPQRGLNCTWHDKPCTSLASASTSV